MDTISSDDGAYHTSAVKKKSDLELQQSKENIDTNLNHNRFSLVLAASKSENAYFGLD